ncbi:hypothetical protein CQW23_15266 [Capsicum baccatum]|uniref:Non-haem dioxygenase N-terminal domain-containing protein n=1 Tax=Capsicum baccatum TaxID=33114 RepID=A0A2G2WLK7_CAPBA|nr:hypothetical protein CQW23_15266 [Capsicum baccatum]
MGSENMKLPIIDFSHEDLKSGTLVWNQVKSQVHKALVEYGCFGATFDKIPIHLRNSIFEVSQEVFNLPLKTKVRNVSTKPFHGYVGQYPAVPLYESMGIDDAKIPHEVEKFTQILWPQGNPTFCKTIQSYSEQLSELDQIVRRRILESLGLEKYTDEHMNSTNYIVRLMNYKAPQSSETKLGLSAHTDKNIVTIMCQNQAWTNGRLHSPYHRVMMTGNEERYSVGLFSIPNKVGYMIQAPQDLVDEEHPLHYKPFDHLEFLASCYSEEGIRCEYPLKNYCGV